MDICSLSAAEMLRLLARGELSSVEIVRAFRSSWEADCAAEKPLQGYIEWFGDAEEKAAAADAARASGSSAPPPRPVT